ncbi:Lrp/AsnC family transcriptional regulator [Leucobacter ruminantium]|uniref:AsnC family transcriptional regulator n=1 Tax=Leucobacter ruminantium TaxID=1289170 RepID=A0A939RWD1_9MICO|nr:AsnC family transcriptional regulator [Leucobacter ruminantium]MBO1804892.1 AsnC family transcriptional regulator [Leucobacter ruminantium]
MDDLTERIVALLRHDGRMAFTKIAAQLGVGREAVADRVRTLTESGRLRIVAGVHPHAVGLPVSAHLSIWVSGPIEPVVGELLRFDSMCFISETTGSFQISAETWLEDTAALRAQVIAIRAIPGVVDVQVAIFDSILDSFFGGEPPSIDARSLDRIDRQILDALQRDGRIPLGELADRVRLSPSGCRLRVLKLIDSGVMKIGAIDQHTGSSEDLLLGFGIKVLDDEETTSRIRESGVGLEFLARTTGRFDLKATIAFSSVDPFRTLMQQLREERLIASSETWLHTRIVRERYERDLSVE